MTSLDRLRAQAPHHFEDDPLKASWGLLRSEEDCNCLAFDLRGVFLAMGTTDGCVFVYDGEASAVVSHLVYVADRNHVTDVWVAGQQLLDNKRLTTINEEDVIQNSKEMGKKVKEHRAEASTVKISPEYRRCC